MKKRKMFVLTAILVLLLCACTPAPVDPTPPPRTDPTVPSETVPDATGETMPEPVFSCQYLPATVDNPDNLPVLQWVCLTDRAYGGGQRVWNEAAAVELNQMLADRSMPYRVQFVLFTVDQWLMNAQWFTRPETQAALQSADLIYGNMTQANAMQYLSPITQYVNGGAEPSLKNGVVHEGNWYSTTVDGEIYGIAASASYPYSKGWVIAPAVLTASALTHDSFQKDFWEMDDVFADIYKNNGNKAFLLIEKDSLRAIGDISGAAPAAFYPAAIEPVLSSRFDAVGSCFSVDFSTDTPTVINHMDTETARRTLQAIIRYQKAGYVTDESNKATVRFGSVIGAQPYTTGPGQLVIPFGPVNYSVGFSEKYMSGIAAVSKHKQEAVSLLKLIAEDEAFRMQLLFGKEGRDYSINSKGYYELIQQADGSNYSLSMLSPYAGFSGLISDPNSMDDMLSPGTGYMQQIMISEKTAREILDDSWKQAAIGWYNIPFDFTDLSAELTAIESVAMQYFRSFSNMDEERYSKMIADFKAAGSEKVLTALQTQLDTWLQDHPTVSAER